MKASELWRIRPTAAPGAVIQGKCFRFTVLTSRLIRMEYAEDGQFRDAATSTALCREFPVPEFRVTETEHWLTVETEHLRLQYDRKPFSATGLSAAMKGVYAVYASVWHYGDRSGNLGGTARTLDEADGEIPLGDGLMSVQGYAVLEDGASMEMDEEGGLHPARRAEEDLYLFAYGHDFNACMRDYLRLSGGLPVVPRFALGNWWSRYYPYTQAGYRALMERFAAERIPLTVSVLDMNWHRTDPDPVYGPGWTGYTWDREKFPEPEKLLAWLHEQGLKVTLNDHPADGVRPNEELYPAMARAMGDDPAEKKPYPFDAADERFQQAYEETVLSSLEGDGVDFWWLDWQQQGGTTDPGMDPLFVLNHRRYLRAVKRGLPALILSRYAGPGSHRYPLGFSGDSCITWNSLDFQPYFTATAANIGYTWWSHDIGGHMHGSDDPELMVRWVQFGVFSPIMRLHSSNNFFMHKEPWSFPAVEAEILKRFLRLRHRLIPWLYTRNVKCAEEGRMLIRPLYYDYPENGELYWHRKRNQYLMGDCLTVCPVTRPAERASGLAETEAWLPEGLWTDFFTGLRYRGGRKLKMYRPLEEMPVLVREGGILPMDARETPGNGAELPRDLLLRCFPGASGASEWIEDNGLLPGEPGYARVTTRILLSRERGLEIRILPPEGALSLLPAGRRVTVEINGFPEMLPDRSTAPFTARYDPERRALRLETDLRPAEEIRLCWDRMPPAPAPDRAALIRWLLERAEISFDLKAEVMRIAEQQAEPAEMLASLYSLELPRNLYGAALEILSAC